MGDVNSLLNKMDELSALENQQLYRKCSLFILTKTWLTDSIPDANMDLQGFTAVRADRDMWEKQRWGTHHLRQLPLS